MILEASMESLHKTDSALNWDYKTRILDFARHFVRLGSARRQARKLGNWPEKGVEAEAFRPPFMAIILDKKSAFFTNHFFHIQHGCIIAHSPDRTKLNKRLITLTITSEPFSAFELPPKPWHFKLQIFSPKHTTLSEHGDSRREKYPRFPTAPRIACSAPLWKMSRSSASSTYLTGPTSVFLKEKASTSKS